MSKFYLLSGYFTDMSSSDEQLEVPALTSAVISPEDIAANTLENFNEDQP